MIESRRRATRDGIAVCAAASTLAAIAAVFVFHPLTPSLPEVGLDASWVAAMGEAADRPLRWGVDVAFTYGPASSLVTGYLNGGWLTRTLPLQIGFSALFGWCAALLVADRRPFRRAAAGTLACGLAAAGAHGTPDAFFLALPMLVLLLAVSRERVRGRLLAMAAGAFALGLTVMAKMSFPLAALPLLALGDGTTAWRRRGPPFLVPLFALGALSGASLYGQRWADLPSYALMQGEVVRGYAAAMSLDGPLWDLASFLASASILLSATAWFGRATGEGRVASAGLTVVLLFLLKAGFIRHDLHSLIAWTGLGLVGTVLAWARLPTRAALAVTAAACLAMFVYEPAMTVRQGMRHGRAAALARIYREWLIEGPRSQFEAAAAAWHDPSGFRADLDDAKREAWQRIARDRPLPALEGGVDIVSSDQTRVMAAGLAYRGRPSFQEYSTYTDKLAAANRAFLEGPDAPRWILFGPDAPRGALTIDDRYPGMAEGSSWPDLLRLYRPERRIGSLVALERRAAPASVPLGEPSGHVIAFDTPLPVDGAAPLWATLDVRPNLAGRVLSALFRPPSLVLDVRFDDGSDRRFRLVPALAAVGFLLSPLVENASDYVALAGGRAAGAGRRVTGLAVRASRAARLFYRADIAVTLRSLTPTVDGTGPAPAVPFAADNPILVGAGLASLPVSDLPVVDGRRLARFDYGTGPDGEGRDVCFSIHPADGTRATLWRRCLKPGDGPVERDSVALSVPDGIEELALEIRCGKACRAPWITASPSGDPAR